MKWIARLFTVSILLTALAVPFFIDNKDGEPMLSLPNSDSLKPEGFSSGTKTTVYKWQDAQGNWHYGDAPPEQQQGVATLEINSNTNLIQGLKPPKASSTASSPSSATSPAPAAAKMTDSNKDILSFERATNVMKDAKLAAKAMEQRNEQLKAIVGESN